MGLPSKTELEAYTDAVAVQIATGLAGVRAECAAKTVSPLFDLVDASTDPVVQNALGVTALVLDDYGLPENMTAALALLLGRSAYANFNTALLNLVKSADGGGYADLRAALTTRSAVIHPLYAELVRRGGEGLFTLATDVTTVAPPAYACIRPTRVYLGTDGSWTDKTADAASATSADVALLASDDDKILIASDRPFSQVIIGLSTVSSADCVITVKYWNGNAFTSVSPTDNTVGLTKNQNLKFTVPSDWTPTNRDGSGNALADKARLYYLEIHRTANTVVTPPVATCISLVPTPILNASGAHLGVPAACPQPPLAIVRVTNTNVVVVEQITEVAYARFKEPTSQLVLRALTPIASTVAFTLAYVKQDGTNATVLQSTWSSIDPLDTLAVVLSGSDGLRSVRESGNSSVNTATNGIFAVECQDLRPPAI